MPVCVIVKRVYDASLHLLPGYPQFIRKVEDCEGSEKLIYTELILR